MHEILMYGLAYPAEARAMGVTDGLTDQELLQELREADGDDIKLRINSRGGSADAAFAMNTLLTQYSGKTLAVIDGLAASAGTIVMLGADRVEIAENAAIMVHKAHVGLYGEFNADDLQEVRNELSNYDKRIAHLYANRVGGTQDDWLKQLDGETYYTAEEAKRAGFVNDISKMVNVRLDFTPKMCKDTPPPWLMKRFGQYQNLEKPVDQDDVARKVNQLLASGALSDALSSTSTACGL